jgi:hypothetical protein
MLSALSAAGVEFLVIGAYADHLVRNKRATGRTQDAADVERLVEIKKG